MAEGGGVPGNLSHGMADLVSYGNAERDVEQVFILFFSRFSFASIHIFLPLDNLE